MNTQSKPSQNLPAVTASKPSIIPQKRKSVSALQILADRLQIDPDVLFDTLSATVWQGCTREEMVALTIVANNYGLNPMLREIYAFPKKGGGIVPVVGVDGWMTIVNKQTNLDGVEFAYEWTDKDKCIPFSCTCTMYMKNRSKPVIKTEYYHENYRGTDNWNKMPCRMLGHRAYIQTARIAFGLAGLVDEDEAATIEREERVVTEVAPSFASLPEPEDDVPMESPTPEPVVEPVVDEPKPVSKPVEKTVAAPKAPAAAPAPVQQAPAPLQDPDALDIPENLTGEALILFIRATLSKYKIYPANFSEYLIHIGLGKEGQKWTDLAESKLLSVLSQWSEHVLAIREM